MRVDGPPRDAPPVECPYLPSREFTQHYFFGTEATSAEAASLQASGWRRFGLYFFRPQCLECQACVPVRLDAANLRPSASQRRVFRQNADVDFSVAPLEYRDEYFEVYQDHSWNRFQKTADREDFQRTFFEPAVPAFVTEYRVSGTLAGLGFCDQGSEGLSSVYFVFRSEYASRSLGTYSILRECQLAGELKLRWYYLGYWVQGNATMAYKGKFGPRQVHNWSTGQWI